MHNPSCTCMYYMCEWSMCALRKSALPFFALMDHACKASLTEKTHHYRVSRGSESSRAQPWMISYFFLPHSAGMRISTKKRSFVSRQEDIFCSCESDLKGFAFTFSSIFSGEKGDCKCACKTHFEMKSLIRVSCLAKVVGIERGRSRGTSFDDTDTITEKKYSFQL